MKFVKATNLLDLDNRAIVVGVTAAGQVFLTLPDQDVVLSRMSPYLAARLSEILSQRADEAHQIASRPIGWGGLQATDVVDIVGHCRCPGRKEDKHDLYCEHAIAAAGLAGEIERPLPELLAVAKIWLASVASEEGPATVPMQERIGQWQRAALERFRG